MYPPTLFERRRCLGVPVMKARHPRLVAYISDACVGLREMIGKGLAEVAVVILGAGQVPLERIVFKLSSEDTAAAGADDLYKQAFTSLRAVLAKISMSGALLNRTHQASIETFELVAYTQDDRITGAVSGNSAGGGRYVSADGRLDWVTEDTRLGRVEIANPQKVVNIKTVIVGEKKIDVSAEQK